ncbi:nucleotidyltransferase substrate binding protein [Compostibacter hankyongensis]|uniref:HI0074 family nucleotidyltransferase substrate-binding subunit n=1 Tax=Compostibacter hankyongensis TaxID=1007089 RepID=A0ABP8FUN3_9BACT
MELAEKFKRTLESLIQAVGSFAQSLDRNFPGLDSVGTDLIKNGRIQKFEYSTELAWKTSKLFAELQLGIISNSPKGTYRVLFQENLIDEDLFLALHKGIEDRNQLSHIYREEMYDLVYADLPGHLIALQRLLTVLTIIPS